LPETIKENYQAEASDTMFIHIALLLDRILHRCGRDWRFSAGVANGDIRRGDTVYFFYHHPDWMANRTYAGDCTHQYGTAVAVTSARKGQIVYAR
jgi:predicted transcriptional regulator